jgi:ABC-2 type transport system permease protein
VSDIFIIFKKEFKSYFLSPIAYVFITVYLVLTNFLFFQSFFLANQADMRSYFSLLPWLFLVFIPAITMRSWAEEKKTKTIELLLTWPVKDSSIVMGKFFAALAFLALALVMSFTVPVSIAILGNPDGGVIVGSYLGSLLLGASYISIGLWVSSLTENQILAFIGSIIIILFFLLIGTSLVTSFVPSQFVDILAFIGITTHFESISRGVIDSRDIIYYLSVIGLFLFLNVQSLESRKWE